MSQKENLSYCRVKENSDWKINLLYMPYKVIRELIYIPYGLLVVGNIIILLNIFNKDSLVDLFEIGEEVLTQINYFKTVFNGHSLLPYMAILFVYLVGHSSISIAYFLFFQKKIFNKRLILTRQMIIQGEETFSSLYRYSHLHSIRAGLVGSMCFSIVLFIPFLFLKGAIEVVFIIDFVLIIIGLLYAMCGAKKVFVLGSRRASNNSNYK